MTANTEGDTANIYINVAIPKANGDIYQYTSHQPNWIRPCTLCMLTWHCILHSWCLHRLEQTCTCGMF